MERWLAAEAEAALPEFRRARPRYYYYYEWMRGRVAGACGALPEPVLDKLLTLEAGELDTLLTYPKAARAKARAVAPCQHRLQLSPSGHCQERSGSGQECSGRHAIFTVMHVPCSAPDCLCWRPK